MPARRNNAKAPAAGSIDLYDRAQSVEFVQANPKKRGCAASDRYEGYKKARTIEEALNKGASLADLKHDLSRGFMRIANAPTPSSSNMGKALGPGLRSGWPRVKLEDVATQSREEPALRCQQASSSSSSSAPCLVQGLPGLQDLREATLLERLAARRSACSQRASMLSQAVEVDLECEQPWKASSSPVHGVGDPPTAVSVSPSSLRLRPRRAASPPAEGSAQCQLISGGSQASSSASAPSPVVQQPSTVADQRQCRVACAEDEDDPSIPATARDLSDDAIEEHSPRLMEGEAAREHSGCTERGGAVGPCVAVLSRGRSEDTGGTSPSSQPTGFDCGPGVSEAERGPGCSAAAEGISCLGQLCQDRASSSPHPPLAVPAPDSGLVTLEEGGESLTLRCRLGMCVVKQEPAESPPPVALAKAEPPVRPATNLRSLFQQQQQQQQCMQQQQLQQPSPALQEAEGEAQAQADQLAAAQLESYETNVSERQGRAARERDLVLQGDTTPLERLDETFMACLYEREGVLAWLENAEHRLLLLRHLELRARALRWYPQPAEEYFKVRRCHLVELLEQPEAITLITPFLQEETERLESELFTMPDKGSFVPRLFVPQGQGIAGESCVELE